MTGKQYRELLKSLNLTKALETQMHTGFRPDFHHVVNKYESHYLPGGDDRKWRPPPLSEDYSKLGKVAKPGMKESIRNWWKSLTPEQRAIQIAKRKANAAKWRDKAKRKGTIEIKHFATRYLVVATKNTTTNANQTNANSTAT